MLKRLWLKYQKRLTIGIKTGFARDVDIRICKTGKLTIGDFCNFEEHCLCLLTMPHPTVDIGCSVVVNRHTVIAAKNKITIGNYTIIAPYCYIIDHEHGFHPDYLILNQKAILKEVHIGRDCWLGAGVKVLAGSNIGDGAIIGAGSVVTSSIPPYQVWAGSPARHLKDRN